MKSRFLRIFLWLLFSVTLLTILSWPFIYGRLTYINDRNSAPVLPSLPLVNPDRTEGFYLDKEPNWNAFGEPVITADANANEIFNDVGQAGLIQGCNEGNQEYCDVYYYFLTDCADPGSKGTESFFYFDLAMDQLKENCKSGSDRACLLFRSASSFRDIDIIDELDLLCEKNNAEACFYSVRIGYFDRSEAEGIDATKLSEEEFLEAGRENEVFELQQERKACSLNFAEACETAHPNSLEFYGIQPIVPQSLEDIPEYRGCALGRMKACKSLGDSFAVHGGWVAVNQRLFNKDAFTALIFLDRACELGDTASCERSQYYRDNGRFNVQLPKQPIRNVQSRFEFCELEQPYIPKGWK